MSIEKLINDFYLEATQEAPTEDQVNKIVNKYGSNADALVNDLYLHFTGNEVPEQQKATIIERYTTPQEVVEEDVELKKKESTSISPEGATELSTEEVQVPTGSSESLEVEQIETEETTPTDPPAAPKRQGSIYVNESTGAVSSEPFFENQDPSTHLMRAEKLDDGNWVAFPSLFQNEDGSWVNLSDIPDEKWKTVYEEAKRRGEVIEFGDNKDEAIAYGEGSWKQLSSPPSFSPSNVEESEFVATEEKPTYIEREFGKNAVTDFFGDMYRAGKEGAAQPVEESLDLFISGKDVSKEEVQNYIKAVKELEALGMSDEMKAFQKTYEEEGSGVYGVLKGLFENPSVAPQVFVSSISSMINPSVGKAAGTGIATGAVIPGAGLVAGIGLATATLETALTFNELLREELGGKEFNEENIMEVLNDPEKLFRIRGRSIARGLIIGAIDGITGGLATKVTKGVLTKTGSKLAAATSGTVVEGGGGSFGEAIARASIGQPLETSDIALEGMVPGMTSAPFTVGKGLLGDRLSNNPVSRGYNKVKGKFKEKLSELATGTFEFDEGIDGSYKINGNDVSRDDMLLMIGNMTNEDISKSNIKVEVKNDDVVNKLLEARLSQYEANNNIPSRITDEADRDQLVKLEKEKQELESQNTQSAKEMANKIGDKIKEITDKYPIETTSVTEEVVEETPTQESQEEELEIVVNGTISREGVENIDKVKDLRYESRGKHGQIIESQNSEGNKVLSLTKEVFDFEGREGYVAVSVVLPKGSTLTANDVKAQLESQMEKLGVPTKVSNKGDLKISNIDKSIKLKTSQEEVQVDQTQEEALEETPTTEVTEEVVEETESTPLTLPGKYDPFMKDINKIENTSKKKEGLKLLLEKQDIENKLEELDKKGENNPNIKKDRERLAQINEEIEDLKNYTESEIDFVNDLIRSKDRRQAALSDGSGVKEKYPRLVEFIQNKKKGENNINALKRYRDAIQESSTTEMDVQQSSTDGEEVGTRDPQQTPSQEIEVTEEVEVEDTTEEQPIEDKQPRTPPKIKEPPKRNLKIDKELDEISSNVRGETEIRASLKAKGYNAKQINRALVRKDKVALTELKNLKKDLKRQGKAANYVIKATKEFKQQLNDIINGMAKDKNITFTKGQLDKIINAVPDKILKNLDVDKALDNAIVEVEKSVRKAYVKDIETNLSPKTVQGRSKKAKGKISPDARRLWQEIKQNYNIKDLKNMTLGELESIDDMLNSIIETGKVDQRSFERVKQDQKSKYQGEVNESLYEKGRGLRENRRQKPKRLNTFKEIEEFLKSGPSFVIINGSKINSPTGLKSYIESNPFVDLNNSKGFESITKDEGSSVGARRSWLGKKYSFVKGLAKSYETIDNMTKKLRVIGGKDVDKKITDLTENIIGARYDQLVGEETAARAVEEQVIKKSGMTSASSRKLLKKQAPSDIYTGLTGDGFTNGQVMYFYMMGKVNGPGIYTESKINEKKLMEYMDQNPELKKLSDNMFTFMKEWAYPRYNSFYESVMGKPLPEVDLVKSFYFPTAREVETSEKNLFEDKSNYEGYTGMNVLSKHMMEKTQKSGYIKPENAMDVLINYLTSMERSMAFQPTAEEFANLFNKESIPQMIYLLGKDGQKEVNKIMEAYDYAITNKFNQADSRLTKILQGVSSLGVVTTLALKTKTMLMGQPVSTLNYYGEILTNNKKYGISLKDLATSTANLFALGDKQKTKVPSAKDIDKEVYFLQRFVTDPMFKSRWKRAGIDPNLAIYKDTKKTTPEKAWDEVSKVALLGVRTGDMGALYLGAPVAQALYNKEISDGYSQSDAYTRAMKKYFSLTTKTQQTSEALFTPKYAKDPMSKALMPYLSAPNAYANLFMEEAKNLRGWKNMSFKEKIGGLVKLMYKSSLAIPFVALMGSQGEEKEEMKKNDELIDYGQYNLEQAKKDRMYGFVADNIQAAISGYGGPGMVVNWAANAARGRPDQFSQPQVLTKIIQILSASPVLARIMSEDLDYDDLEEKDKKEVQRILGNLDNAVELFSQLKDGDITLKDWALERPKDYGSRGKLKYYDRDFIRNYIFNINNYQESGDPEVKDMRPSGRTTKDRRP